MILHFSHMGLTEGRTFTISVDSFEELLTDDVALAAVPAAATSRGFTVRARAFNGPPTQRAMLAAGMRQPRGSGGRLGGVFVPGRQDPRAGGRDRHGELEMGGQRAVLGVERPPVGPRADTVAPGGDHGLDRQGHPLLQPRALARIAEVRYLRVLVHLAPDPVPNQRAHDR